MFDSAAAIANIWGMNQFMGALSLCFSKTVLKITHTQIV